VNYVLTETCRNPAAYIEEFSKRIEIGNIKIDDKINNIVRFQPKNDTLEEDDYDY
jgi:hypothetical protein